MLLRLAENIRQCLDHAAEAAERARSQQNPERKAELLELERAWLRLAESYRFVEQLELFILDGQRYARGLSNKEIARELGVTEATVKNSVSKILAKLSVKGNGN